MRLLCIGDTIVDRYTELRTIGRDDDGVAVLEHVLEWNQPGGAAAVAAMVKALGHDVTFIGTGAGRILSVQHRTIIDGKVVGRRPVTVHHDESAAVLQDIEALKTEPTIVLLADYGRGVVSRAVVEACLARDWQVLADPHGSTKPSVFNGVWAVVPNRREDEDGRYWESPEQFPRCCLKRDRDGVLVRDIGGTETVFESTAAMSLFDTCGAGDQLFATLGVALALGAGWLEACRTANVAAGLKCANRGTTPVTLDELNQTCGKDILCGQPNNSPS